MKVTYDAEVDVLRIVLSNQRVDGNDEDKPGVIIDYDALGNVVSMEILDASRRGMSPHGVEYAITGLKRLTNHQRRHSSTAWAMISAGMRGRNE